MNSCDQKSEEREKVKEKIKRLKEELKKYKKFINPQEDESSLILSRRKSKKEDELKECYWFQFLKKSEIADEIKRLQTRMSDLMSLEEKEKEIEDLEKHLKDLTPGNVWEGYPEILDDKIVDEYRDKFKVLANNLTPEVPFINILVIGETGAGKSSLLNTFVTAVTDSPQIKDIYRAAPGHNTARSSTKRLHYEPIYIGGIGPELPCKFYDIPGIDDKNTFTEDRLEKVIDGKLKIDVRTSRLSNEDIERKNPTLADKIHCIIYVVNAGSNPFDDNPRQGIVKKILKSKHNEDGLKQYVFVTAIDTIGVPNDDMKNAYRYKYICDHCKKVSDAFDVDLLHVLPVSNFFREGSPNVAKNAMSLLSVWRVVNSGKEYIERQLNKK